MQAPMALTRNNQLGQINFTSLHKVSGLGKQEKNRQKIFLNRCRKIKINFLYGHANSTLNFNSE